jgi:indolepyruvate ferredoxin oxidoreductase beta subunit
MNANPITLLVCALGGEGGGVLTEWLVDVARQTGYAAQATSIPGVAQRTGATTYYIEVFPVPLPELQGRKPVFSLNPVPGALDAIVSSELLETVRQLGNGMASADRTLVITSSSRALTTLERMQPGDGRVGGDELAGVVRRFSRAHRIFDMNAAATQSGTIVSAVMLGAIAGSGLFPFTREDYENVVRAGGGASAQASLRGFAAGFDACARQSDSPRPGVDPGVTNLIELGRRRVLDYQDEKYAALYDERLARIPAGETREETARWLALWMAYDDVIRVADLKSRASRFDRVRREVKAGDADLVRVYDHFKPGAPEFAALLPPSLARRVERQTWSMPVRLAAHSLTGMLALRLLASLKWLRPKSSRYAAEQQMIERWLAAIVEGARRDPRLGLEIAKAGRLIKGYGTTNERAKDNLLHIVDVLAAQGDAQAVAHARELALAKETPQPVKEQPIRFMRRRVETTIPGRAR